MARAQIFIIIYLIRFLSKLNKSIQDSGATLKASESRSKTVCSKIYGSYQEHRGQAMNGTASV